MRKSAPVRFGSARVRLPLCTPGQRVGLLGGSFNPPHAAHVLISEIALARLGLDRVWWVVSPGNVLKPGSDLAPLARRLDRCRALARDPRIVVTAFEAGLASRFTAATVAFLKARRRGVRFVWLMGADCLAEFDRWQLWRELLDAMPVAVIDRPGWRLRALAGKAAAALARHRLPEPRARRLALARPPAWTYLSGPLSPLSSTALRGRSATPARRKQK
jgi:nicotinate-nucleotide adenylyltransferase